MKVKTAIVLLDAPKFDGREFRFQTEDIPDLARNEVLIPITVETSENNEFYLIYIRPVP